MKAQEQQENAKAFIEYWTNRGDEKSDTQQFWTNLLTSIFGIAEPQAFIEFEKRVKLTHTSFIDAYIPSSKVLIEQKGADIDLCKGYRQSDGAMLTPFQQAKRYANEMPYSSRPRWVVVCNFQEFLVYDMEKPNGEPYSILLKNLEKEYSRLSFLTDEGNIHLKREMELSIKAGELVGKIYDALLAQYKDATNPETLRSLNVLCVRLVFLLYAEDAGIFGIKNMFCDYMSRFQARDFRRALIDLFQVLDTKKEDRDAYLDADLAQFPYVNGGLFSKNDIEIPQFTDELRQLILSKASADFDWSEISPTIFGAVFESTLNPETRRSGGMHYTSIENIHKVIDPLFLNELRDELKIIKAEPIAKTQLTRAREFQDKLASLKFLDPACGSGNFLTESYLSLRRLENEAILLQTKGQVRIGYNEVNPIKVSIHQFYGIEINDFAVSTATTALWIAESQMLNETSKIIQFNLDMLPLKTYHNIKEGNALRLSWTEWEVVDSGQWVVGSEENVVDSGQWIVDSEENTNELTNKTNNDGTEFQRFNSLAEIDGRGGNGISFGEEITKGGNVCSERPNAESSSVNSLEYCRGTRESDGKGICSLSDNSKGLPVRIGNAVDSMCQNQIFDGQGYTTHNNHFDRNCQNDQCANSETINQKLTTNHYPLSTIHFDYIMGNPPFVGGMMMSKEQKQDLIDVFGGMKGVGEVDFVSAWYVKASEIMQNTVIKAALVSTNSITQGEQVSLIWRYLYEKFNIHIDFAYRTFRWDSEASLKAHVHCVIVGFSCDKNNKGKIIFSESETPIQVETINPYLIDAPSVWIDNRSTPLCKEIPLMNFGNMPRDGGGFILSENEKNDLLKKEPIAKKWIHEFPGAVEFLHNKKRYCLWLQGANPTEIKQCPTVLKRVTSVREMRLASKAASTRKFAETPTLFAQITQPLGQPFILMPRVSSERRRYVPMGFMKSNVISSDATLIIPNATLYHFGILTSNVHMAWMRVVCGRLKSDYRYSKDIVYNNFPWPTPTDEQTAKIEQTAQAILDARAKYPESSLADLYDEVTMPSELRKAHQENDKAVMQAYGFSTKMTESECVAALFKMYEELVKGGAMNNLQWGMGNGE